MKALKLATVKKQEGQILLKIVIINYKLLYI